MQQQRRRGAVIAERGSSRGLNLQLVALLDEQLDLRAYPLHRARAGTLLHGSGEPLLRLPLLESGSIDAVVPVGRQGRRIVPISFEAGELALLSALFAQEPMQVDLVATCAVSLRWLPLSSVEACIAASQPLLVLVVRFLAQRLREAQARERGWMERGVHERVVALLARLLPDADPRSPDDHPWLNATHEALAARCGVSRPKLSHELKALERAGSIRLHRGAIEFLDRTAFGA